MKGLKRAQILGGILLIALVVAWTQAPTADTRHVQVIQKALDKTVMVYVTTDVERLEMVFDDKTDTFSFKKSTASASVRGAGVFVSPFGHILTAAHVVTVGIPRAFHVELFDGHYYEAEVLNVSDKTDVALMKIDVPFRTPYVRLADTRHLRVGQEVFTIGNPLGFAFSVSHGIISNLNADMSSGYNLLQADTFMNPGNSGGPLLNYNGELVGICSRIVPPVNAPIFTGLGFSVEVGQIFEYLTKFKGLGV